jgi:hypothetical protein
MLAISNLNGDMMDPRTYSLKSDAATEVYSTLLKLDLARAAVSLYNITALGDRRPPQHLV